jgi:hypothetical protein
MGRWIFEFGLRGRGNDDFERGVRIHIYSVGVKQIVGSVIALLGA